MDEQSNEWTIKWMNHWISRTADGQTDCHTNNERKNHLENLHGNFFNLLFYFDFFPGQRIITVFIRNFVSSTVW